MPNNDTDIRLAVKTIIKNLYPNAQVFAWNALSHDISEWAGMFRNDKDELTHGWIIKTAAATAQWKNGKRDKKQLPIDVWGFYGFRSGNEADNSDNEFAEIREAIYEAIKAVPTLNFSGTVEGHDLLQFPVITTLESGEETLHFAQGRLVVHLCC